MRKLPTVKKTTPLFRLGKKLLGGLGSLTVLGGLTLPLALASGDATPNSSREMLRAPSISSPQTPQPLVLSPAGGAAIENLSHTSHVSHSSHYSHTSHHSHYSASA